MKYRLIEHLVEGKGITEVGVGWNLFSKPIRIIDADATPPIGFQYADSIQNWNTYGRDYANKIGLDSLFVRDRIEETGLLFLENTLEVYNDPTLIPLSALIQDYMVIVGDNPINDFVNYNGLVAHYDLDNGWTFHEKVDMIIDLVTTEEARILVQNQIGSMPKNMKYFPSNDVYTWVGDYNKTSRNVRGSRIEWCATFITSEIPLYANNVITDLIAAPEWQANGFPVQNMYWNYTELGIRGTLEDTRSDRGAPSVGIIDYLLGRSIFEGSGFDTLNVLPTTSDLTKDKVANILYKVLVLGLEPHRS